MHVCCRKQLKKRLLVSNSTDSWEVSEITTCLFGHQVTNEKWHQVTVMHLSLAFSSSPSGLSFLAKLQHREAVFVLANSKIITCR